MKWNKLALCLIMLLGCTPTKSLSEGESNQLMTFSDYKDVNYRPVVYDIHKPLRIHSKEELDKLAVNYDYYKIYDSPNLKEITEMKDGYNYKVVYHGGEERVAIWVRYEEIIPEDTEATDFTLYPYNVDYGATYHKASLDRFKDSVVTLDGVKLTVKVEKIIKAENTVEGTYYCNSLYVNVGGEKCE